MAKSYARTPSARERSPSKESASTSVPRSPVGDTTRSTVRRDSRSPCPRAASPSSADESSSPKPRPPEAEKPRGERGGHQDRGVHRRRRTNAEIWRCKKGRRTDIKPGDWSKFGYADRDEVLHRPIVYDKQTVPIPRVKRSDITPEWFQEHYASKSRPVIVEGVTNHWPAMTRWNVDAMEERFRHTSFKVAKDDKGKKLRTKFKYYADYLRTQRDDSPLYLFETSMEDDAPIRELIHDFEVPDLFPHDLLSLVNRDARPPFRWFCIGPKRSGTTVHTDPLGTAAWNAVTHGVKHWVLFEPQESRRVVKGKDFIHEGEDDEAIMYYDFILPRIKRAHPEVRVYEGLQKPGDLIFVPGDWWHAVLNIEDCVAVTQNYVGPDNFDMVWKKTRKEREKLAYLWLRNMRKFAPRLHDRALALNRRDNFRMRHERAKGEKLSSGSSSSSASSSDSSSDEAGDLDPVGLRGVALAPHLMGHMAWRRQGSPRPNPMPEPTRSLGEAVADLGPPLPGEGTNRPRKRHRDREDGHSRAHQ
uniref:JmjC domain-containing protein n=1 Tax=Noctiluca scintillans TaxID=2966 RepID=A0A7S1ALC0_NOCSC|mmetsp:Transcript_51082/g.136272  ORF Transcript_51082/g.136272 Transcript_51082/m.136272 type:complete len:530 (+) Transcript_51082:53-1642(+)